MTLLPDSSPAAIEVKSAVFAPEFQTAEQWLTFLEGNYGSGLKVDQLLNMPGESWQISHFHAPFVACFVFQPLAKGSFMIELTDAQRVNVREGYGKLEARWTSHLHEHGRSAHADWSFLKGYGELLCQMEGAGKNVKSGLGKTANYPFEGWRHAEGGAQGGGVALD